MNITLLIFTALTILFSQPVLANDLAPDYFKHYNRENGLISNNVQSIIEDSNGLIWIGCENGLCSFDGYSFTEYTNDITPLSSANDNFICAITSDSLRQCLWIVTASGISKFNLTTYQFQNYDISQTNKSTYSPFAKGSICVDSNNNIWAIVSNNIFTQNLFRYDEDENRFINLSELRSDVPKYLTQVTKDKDNTLWFGSLKGLYYYDNLNKTFVSVNYNSEHNEALNIHSLFVDSDNILWIGAQTGNSLFTCVNKVIRKVFETNEISTKSIHFTSSISEYNENIIIAGVKDKGLLFYNKKTTDFEILQPNLYKTNSIKSKVNQTIYTDNIGNVWIGSSNNGINLIDKNKKAFKHYSFNYTEQGLLNNNVRALYEDSDGDIWIGTKEGGGISQFFPETGTFENIKADESKKNWLTNDIVISLSELEPGKLLVGTYGSGIFIYHKKRKLFSQFSIADGSPNTISNNLAYTIYKDQEGLIWIGTNGETNIYNPKDQTLSRISGVRQARCFLDIGNAVLIGTWSNGLYSYSKEDQQTRLFELNLDELSITAPLYNGIAIDTLGNIWFATNKGLLKHNRKSHTTNLFTELDGLSNDFICAVQVDNNNNLWASTKNGISELVQSDNTIKNYDKNDGLQSSSFQNFASLKRKNGDLFFAGTNGFNVFSPEQIKDNPNIPNVMLTDFLIFNKPVEIGTPNSPLQKHINVTNKIILDNEQSSFSLRFTAINYTSPEKNKYKYMLEGYDNTWQRVSLERIANYTQVPPGNYTFKVVACNNDGVWTKTGVLLKIKIKPPLSKSKGAFLAYTLLIIILLLIFRIIILRDQRNKSRIQAEIREKKIIEQTGRNRLRFFTNISHELRTPLTLITSPLEALMNYETDDQKLQSTIQNMNRNAQRLLRLVNQLMDFRKVEENRIRLRISNERLITDIKETLHSFEYLANSKGIKCAETHFRTLLHKRF